MASLVGVASEPGGLPLLQGCKRRRNWRRKTRLERGGEGKEERKEEEKIKGVAGLVRIASEPGGLPL